MKTKNKSKRKTPAQLKKECDRLFSIMVRMKSSNKDGFCECYTCDTPKPWKEMQAGHFVSRVHLTTRWLEENVRTQCFMCNFWKNGNMDVFAKRLVDECGPGILTKLNHLRNTTTKMSRQNYLDLMRHLNEEIEQLRQNQ